MTAPGGGGDRLEVPVVANAAGFSKGLQGKIDAEVKAIRARIRAEVDTARLQAQAAAAAKRTEQQTKIRLKVGVDAKYLRESIKAALAGVTNGEFRVKVEADVDTDRVERALNAASNTRTSSVEVDADTGPARESVERFRQEQERRPVEVPIRTKVDRRSSRSTLAAIKSISRLAMAAGALAFAAPAASALAAGLLSVASAASQAVGIVGALPGLIGVAAQGIGVIAAGFKGVGGAVTALRAPAPAGGGGGGAAAAKAQEQAQRRIADARQRVADVFASTAKAITRAERSVADAQKGAQAAQESLTRARRDATERLEDYKLSLSGAALDEEDAALAVERARERWNETMRNPVSTELDRKEVDLALRQAEQRLAEVRESNGDLQQEAGQALAAGVEGSAEVIAAQADVADANQAVADAEAELADERVQATRDVADAQRDLAEAIDDAADAAAAAAGGGVSKLQEAMDNLSPAGQRLARFLADTMMPRLQRLKFAIQEKMLPGFQTGLENAMPVLDTIQPKLERTGAILGQFGTDLGTLVGSDVFRRDVATIMDSNNDALVQFSGTGLNLVGVLKELMVGSGDLIVRFATWTNTLTAGWSATLAAKNETGELAAFFQRAGDRAAQLGRIFRDLFVAIFNIGKQGVDTGDSLLGKLEDLVAKFREWTESVEGQKAIRQWFEDMQPLFEKLVELGGNLAETFGAIADNGGGGLGAFLDTLNAILTVINSLLTGPMGPFLIGLMQVGGVLGAISFAGAAVLGPIRKIGGAFDTVKTAWDKASSFVDGLRGGAAAAEDAGSRAATAGSKLAGVATSVGTFIADMGRAAWAAITSAAQASAAWARAAASTIASWVSMAVSATINAVTTAAVWVAQTVAAAATVTAQWVAAQARAVAAWVVMATQASVNAIRVGAVWLAQTLASTGAMLIQWGITVAAVIAGWVTMGAQSLIRAAQMAAAWVIAMGPIGWAIAAVIGLVALIIANWDTIKRVTSDVFGRIASTVSGIWSGLGNGLKGAMNGIIGVINGAIGGVNTLIRGINKVPGVNIGEIPKIPKLAQGAYLTKPTLAVIGEDGDELALPLDKPKRRDELLRQAGLPIPSDLTDLGGWGRADSSAGPSLATRLADAAPVSTDISQRSNNVGTVIEEGAIQQTIVNPKPETAGETLNSRLRRLASVGIFDSKPTGS